MYTSNGPQPAARNLQSETSDHSPPGTRTTLWLVAAVIVALLLRVHCLIYPYLWLDEFVTLWSIGGATYGKMLDRSLHWTASGPLFVLCYRVSLDLVGDAEWGLKLPGVLFGTFSVWAAWWTTRQLYDRSDVAIVAAWLVALAPQFIHFSQEGRPYMIGALLVMLTTGFLAAWLRNQRWYELAALVALSLAAVGFHLLAALALVAQNVFVFLFGMLHRWPRRLWFKWLIAQLVVAVGLWFAGAQFRMLSGRQGSMILETNLPMPTRHSLDRSVWGQLQVELTISLVGMAIWWCARRFPRTELAKAWNNHAAAILLAAVSYLVPTFLLTMLSFAHVLDSWARYYFLFHAGFMLVLAWVVVCAFPRRLSQCLLAMVVISMVSQFNAVGGIPSCRLNGIWLDFSAAGADLRKRIGPDDLVLSRSGLIEANHLRFLNDPDGASYLKSFLEAKDGVLQVEHFPLPFSPESQEMRQYLDQLFERLAKRKDFWLVNLGTPDFDYDDWIAAQFGEQIRKVEQLDYPALSIYRYVSNPIATPFETVKNKGTSDWVPATFSKVPCQRSVLE